jgi:hypothetical protein
MGTAWLFRWQLHFHLLRIGQPGNAGCTRWLRYRRLTQLLFCPASAGGFSLRRGPRRLRAMSGVWGPAMLHPSDEADHTGTSSSSLSITHSPSELLKCRWLCTSAVVGCRSPGALEAILTSPRSCGSPISAVCGGGGTSRLSTSASLARFEQFPSRAGGYILSNSELSLLSWKDAGLDAQRARVIPIGVSR